MRGPAPADAASSPPYCDHLGPAGPIGQQVRRHALARQRQRLPARAVSGEEAVLDRRHPEVARRPPGSASFSSQTPQAWLSHSSTSVLMNTRKKPAMSGSRTRRSMASWTASRWMRAMHSARRRSLISRASASAHASAVAVLMTGSRPRRRSRRRHRCSSVWSALIERSALLRLSCLRLHVPPPCLPLSATGGSSGLRHPAEAQRRPKVADATPACVAGRPAAFARGGCPPTTRL